MIGHELKHTLIIKEYGIKAKPRSSGNTTSNEILEIIHLDLGYLVQAYNVQETYLDKDDTCMVILVYASLKIIPNTNRLKGYTPGQLIFGRDMIYRLNITKIGN